MLALCRVVCRSCILLLFSTCVSATTVIVVRTPDKIILAADAKAIHLDGRPPDSVCKISKIGSLYFSFTGFDSAY